MGGTDVAGRRRRVIAGVLTVGVVVGVAVGVVLRSPALKLPRAARGPVLVHSARAFVIPGRPMELQIAAFCAAPQDPELCALRSGTIHVTRTDGATVAVPGTVRDDRVTFELPSSLVERDFRYWIGVENALGRTTAYPPGAPEAGLEVRTTAGFREVRLGAFTWRDTLPGTPVLELPYGAGPGQVGILPPQGDGLASGESSFDVGPAGDIYVADRVNRRIQIFDREGRYRAELPLPDQRAVDIAVGSDGAVYAATLGDRSQVAQIRPDGSSEPATVPFGVVARVRAGASGPVALVGDAQYIPVPVGPGASLTAAEQGRLLRAAPPAPEGGTALTGPVDDGRFAVAWTDPDGGAHGVLVRLPPEVAVGSDYFTVPLPDGGALVAQGLYAPGHNVVGILRLDRSGRLVSFTRLPEPSFRQDARWSTVRWRDPDEVLVIYEDPQGVRIDRFEVI